MGFAGFQPAKPMKKLRDVTIHKLLDSLVPVVEECLAGFVEFLIGGIKAFDGVVVLPKGLIVSIYIGLLAVLLALGIEGIGDLLKVFFFEVEL